MEEGQVEPVQVVILDDVGIRRADPRDESPDQLGLGGVTRDIRLEHLGRARRIAHRDHKDAVVLRE